MSLAKLDALPATADSICCSDSSCCRCSPAGLHCTSPLPPVLPCRLPALPVLLRPQLQQACRWSPQMHPGRRSHGQGSRPGLEGCQRGALMSLTLWSSRVLVPTDDGGWGEWCHRHMAPPHAIGPPPRACMPLWLRSTQLTFAYTCPTTLPAGLSGVQYSQGYADVAARGLGAASQGVGGGHCLLWWLGR